jgi:hypothetical protein
LSVFLLILNNDHSSARLVLARFRTAHYQSTPEEFLVVQFLHSAFRFLDGLHLDERKSLGALVVPVADYLGVLHMADAVKQLKEIALSGVEGKVADVQAWRRDFDDLRFAWRARRLGAVARGWSSLLCGPAISKKFDHPLPECLFLSLC